MVEGQASISAVMTNDINIIYLKYIPICYDIYLGTKNLLPEIR